MCVLKLLKPSGMLVFTVPNYLLLNSGDYFVIDHINKFTFSVFIKQLKFLSFLINYKILEDIFKGSFFVVVSNKDINLSLNLIRQRKDDLN